MSTYYRRTDGDSPLSDWGHAMLCDDLDNIEGYGDNLYAFDGSDAPHIADLKDDIIEAWDYDRTHGFTGDFGSSIDEAYWQQIPGEDIYQQFNPRDIVDSAEAWDSELTQWIYDRVLDPRSIMAVLTYDGAIVFDEQLLDLVA